MVRSGHSGQTWFAAFVAIAGVVSFLPYRERALLPAPSRNEQGFFAQEISQGGTSGLVNNAIAGSGSARINRDTVAGRGARRLIPALAQAAGVPGTSTLTGGAGLALPLVSDGVGDVAGADGNIVNLAAAPGTFNTPPGQGETPGSPDAPQGPAVLSGVAGELLAAVVPEPSTWLLFIAGLMLVGRSLRKAQRGALTMLQKS